MNQLLQKIGLFLFTAAFALFLASFFLASYQMTQTVVSQQISEPAKQAAFEAAAGDFMGKTYADNFSFINDLVAVFEQANQQVAQQYGITPDAIEQMVVSSQSNEQIVFKMAIAEQVLNGDSEAQAFTWKQFQDNGGWLDNRTYNDAAALTNDLTQVAENIRKYAIIPQKGFDKYAIKNYRFSMTKAASSGPVKSNPMLFIFLTYGLSIIGALLYILPKRKEGNPGIKNNHIFQRALTNRGWLGISVGTFLIIFYIFLYFYPAYMVNWVVMVDPISHALSGNDAGRFFLYGYIYTLCILVMGVRMFMKYRHSPYQQLRTISVMFFQTAFAFLIPEILVVLNQPYFDFKNIWPLDYDFFFGNELDNLVQSGGIGIFMLVWGIALIIVGVPLFTFFFGKRWYCSWVCGCGGLAETLGDPYRQLSDKSLRAWKIERFSIHGVMVFAVVMTIGVLYTYFTESSQLLGINTYDLRSVYGAWIGAGFAGVVGTGFYPFMGNRVWCRFGCPLAGYLGLMQRLRSRFRITTNGGQCISCGNCSTYCEMGIDVRWYAQRGQNIVRSSCVGCGVCSAVCPRGVLNLENLDETDRTKAPEVILGRD